MVVEVKKEAAPVATPVKKEPVLEEEDISKLPQERPHIIQYSKQMIMDFIKRNESKLTDDKEQFEFLVREITEVQMADKGGFDNNRNYNRDNRNRRNNYGGGNDRHGGGGGGRGGNDRNNNRRREKDEYVPYRDDRNRGGRRREKDRYSKDGPGGNNGVLQRQTMTDEQAQRMKDLNSELKNEDGQGLITKESNKQVSDIEKSRTAITIRLLKLAPETKDMVVKELTEDCQDLEVCEMAVKMIIVRAWGQPQYTKMYAEVVSKLGSSYFKWAEGATEEEQMNNGKKKFKSIVISMVKREFLHGFDNFKNKMIKVDEEDTPESVKFEDYNSAKKKLKGNINFISELYLVKFLPHKVIKFICYKLTLEFIKESIKSVDEQPIQSLQYPMHEEYIESLIVFIENAGQKISQKERKIDENKPPTDEQIAYQDDLIEYLIKHFKDKNFDEDFISKVIPDDARKNMNVINYSFRFMEAAVGKKIFSIRLKILFKNLKIQRKEGWKKKIDDSHAKSKKDLAAEWDQEQREAAQRSNRGGGYGYERRDNRRDRDDYQRRDRGGRDDGYVRKRGNERSSRNNYDDYSPDREVQAKKNNRITSTNMFENLGDEEEEHDA